MPQILGDPIIRHVWRPRSDLTHIHYLAITGPHQVHLRAASDDPLYPVLNEALARTGLVGTHYPGRVAGGVPPLAATRTPMLVDFGRALREVATNAWKSITQR